MKKSQMMKGFKFGLVGLLVGLFGLTCFSNAGNLVYTHSGVLTDNNRDNIIYLSGTSCDYFMNCIFDNTSLIYATFDFQTNNGNYSWGNNKINNITHSFTFLLSDLVNCSSINYISVKGSSNYQLNFTCDFYEKNCQECEECQECPSVDTGAILSGSCDTNYCVQNDLCPVSSGGWSELVINDIVHQSAPLININIPEEYSWDYTVDDNEFALDISGQNVDYEYIDGVIRTQKFTPDDEDFSNIVTGLVPLLIPGLVIILFIWFIFRFIKKIF